MTKSTETDKSKGKYFQGFCAGFRYKQEKLIWSWDLNHKTILFSNNNGSKLPSKKDITLFDFFQKMGNNEESNVDSA